MTVSPLPDLRVSLLRGVVVWRGGVAVEVPGPRLRGLLALLALTPGEPRRAEYLADQLWNGEPPSANALQALVSRLRRILGAEAVLSGPAGYVLAVEPRRVDLVRFDELAEAGTAPAARAALALVGAQPLAEFADVPDLADEARRIEAGCMRLLALISRSDEARSAAAPGRPRGPGPGRPAGRGGGPVGAGAPGQANAVTLRDAAARGAAPQSAALRTGAATLDPQAAQELTARLNQAAYDFPAASRYGGHATASVIAGPRLIGRDGLIAEINERLATTRLLTLVGAGGAGKTSLAKAVARLRDEAVVAELAPVRAEAVAAEVFTAVGGREILVSERTRMAVNQRDYPDRVTAALAGRSLLLVLDNCEHVVDSAARLAELILDRCPEVTILTTSREPLSLPGEVRLPVDPLPVPPRDEPEERLGEYAAVQLLVERGRAVRPGLVADGPEGPALAEICRRLDGSPLALELAAARFHALTPRQVADRLDDRFRLLTRGSRTALPRQQTLRAVVDWSWDLLDRRERELLALLSVFVGGALLEDVEAVAERCVSAVRTDEAAAGAGSDAASSAHLDANADSDILDTLDRLVAKSLVVAEPRNDHMRYRLLETIREYARERLTESGGLAAVHTAHAEHYADFAARADRRLRGPEQVEWISRLDEEEDNLRAALTWSYDREHVRTAMRLCTSLSWYWMLRGRRDGERWHRPLTGLAERLGEASGTDYAHMLALSGLGAFETFGPVNDGTELLRRAHAAFDATGGYSIVSAMVEMMLSFVETGGFAQAVRRIEPRCLEHGDRWGLAVIRMFEARTLADSDADEAERKTREALAFFADCGDRWGMSECWQVLGYIADVRGDHAAALAAFDAASRIAAELGALGDMLLVQIQTAWEYEFLGRPEEADALLDTAQAAAERRGRGEQLCLVYVTRCDISRRRGDIPAARAWLDRATATRYTGRIEPPFRAMVSRVAGAMEAALGEHRRAAAYFRRGIQASTSFFFEAMDLAGCIEGLAAVAVGLGEPATAATLLGAIKVLRPVDPPPSRLRDVVAVGRAARAALAQPDGPDGPDGEYERAFARGEAMSRDDVAEYAQSLAERYADGVVLDE